VLFTFPSRYLFTIGHPGVFSLTRWCWQIQTGFHRSRPTQDPTRSRSLTSTGLSPSVVRRSSLFEFTSFLILWSYNPAAAVTTTVWASPRSLATTWGITVVFFSSRYLDVSVPWVRSLAGYWVAPFGDLRINACLRLPEAYRSLPRPSSPPDA
jgi:hypothetical protein